MASFRDLDEQVWEHVLTPRVVVEHMRRILDADLKYPIILSSDGWVMDGCHRLAKALAEGRETVTVVQFQTDPPPDASPTYVIAADEVGRGCLAGPLCVGAVLVPAGMAPVAGVTDSKALTARQREDAAERLAGLPGVRHATTWVPASIIDQIGMKAALASAFGSAVRRMLSVVPEGGQVIRILIDGNPQDLSFFGEVPVTYLVKGDALDWRIGAASIIAKVERDQMMVAEAEDHPGYGWERNMGYGSAEHQEAIRAKGLTPLHRVTFCRRFTAPKEPDILDLFD